MKRRSNPITFVRRQDRKSVLKAIFLREAVFRKAITAEAVREGLRPRKAAASV
jgi:hypothetical protein